MTCGLMRARDGVVYAEFLMSFMFFFTLFVGTVQLSVVATAGLVVQHAAVQAVRAAIVTIDDDPAFYDEDGGGQRKHLERDGNGKGGEYTEKVLDFIATGSGHKPAGLGGRGTERVNRIRNAAYLPLSVISPTAEQVARWVPFATSVNPALAESSLYDDIGDIPLMRIITGFGVYGRIGAAITFPMSPGSKELRNGDDAEFQNQETVTVRVTYLLPCNVPLARSLVCDDVIGMTGIPDAGWKMVKAVNNPSFETFESAYDAWVEAGKRTKTLEQSMLEMFRAEWSWLQLPILARPGERFVFITREASLPNHGAAYKYHSELESKQGGTP